MNDTVPVELTRNPTNFTASSMTKTNVAMTPKVNYSMPDLTVSQQ
jgi:hypothetical protein